MADGSSLKETIVRLERRLLRERKKREQIEEFAEKKTRQLFQEKEKVDLMNKIINATSRNERLLEACRATATILIDFNKIDGFTLLEMVDSEVNIKLHQADQELQLNSIDFTQQQWLDVIHDNKQSLKYTFESTIEQTKVFHWIYRISKAPTYFFILNFISKQKYLEFNEQLLNHCGQQLKLVVGRQRSAELIHNISHFDQLTQLCSKPVFESRLAKIIKSQESNNVSFAVIGLNIADMGLINTQYSIDTGSQIIKFIASEIGSLLRLQDSVTRHAGDGFLLYLVSDHIEEAVEGVIGRINQRFKGDLVWNGERVKIRFHIGYAIEDARKAEAALLMQYAEVAVKQAKKRGTPQQFKTEMLDKAIQVQRLDLELNRALENNEFQLYYQPIVDLKTLAIVKAEALIRWNKDGRLIPPVEFIPHLEEGDLIIPVGRWIIEQALADFKAWSNYQTDLKQVGVNLSVRQFSDDSLDQWIATLLGKYALSSSSLVLEITESLSLDPTEQMSQFIERFKELGIDIALDDFGTGYSSLSYLHRYPFSNLKIDRSFIINLDSGDKSIKLLQSIVALSASLELMSIAEGIESEAVARLLKHMGVDYGQGYYFSRPVPADEFLNLLKKQS